MCGLNGYLLAKDSNVACLSSSFPFSDLILQCLVLLHVVVIALDCAEVHKDIGTAIIWSNETVALFSVEPFHFSC